MCTFILAAVLGLVIAVAVPPVTNWDIATGFIVFIIVYGGFKAASRK